MANRIVLNPISYHGKGAIENIVPELTSRGYKKAFVCSDPALVKAGVTAKVTDLLDKAGFAYEKLMAEENADLAIKYGVKQAPTLVIVSGAGFEKFAGAGAIKQFLSK